MAESKVRSLERARRQSIGALPVAVAFAASTGLAWYWWPAGSILILFVLSTLFLAVDVVNVIYTTRKLSRMRA